MSLLITLASCHSKTSPDVAQLLAHASEQDIKEYQTELNTIRNRTSTDLQQNVYQNRNQFIKISQEAEKLKAEMRALRSLMSDLTTTLGQTSNVLGIDSDRNAAARKFANRSSVANLEALWTTHLQELWRRVEGSQKFLPASPGRHVIHESGKWVELNPATWKPRRRVHLILLNDHLLVASEKKHIDNSASSTVEPENPGKHTASTSWQLVADRCWPLQDMDVVDIASKAATGRGMSRLGNPNTITVRCDSESFTYASTEDDASEKNAFLARYRKAAADFQKSLHTDAEIMPSNRRSSAVDLFRSSVQQGIVPKSSMLGKPAVPIDVDGKQQPFRWIEQQVDELDIDVALQRFEDAVSRVDRLRQVAAVNKHNHALQEIMTGKVQERSASLCEILVRHLSDTHASTSSTHQRVAWLIKLGFETRASEGYLEARRQVVKTRVRYVQSPLCNLPQLSNCSQCIDQGDLGQYLYEVSYIIFTLIRNTVNVYQSCFTPLMQSSCIKWTKEQVDGFNASFSQQTRKMNVGSTEYQECLERAREHAQLLTEVGIDVKDLIGQRQN